jgi:hypothetical protein
MTQSDLIKVYVPGEVSVVNDASGLPHYVDLDSEGRRFALLPIMTARALLNSGLPSSIAWRAVNSSQLIEALGQCQN